MNGVFADRALEAAIADAERMRAVTGHIPSAVQQMQEDFEQRRALYRQVEGIYEIFQSPAFQQLREQLEHRQEFLRQMSLSSAAGIQAARSDFEAVSDVLYRHREVIDPLVFATFYGSGASPPVTSSFRKANRKLAKSYKRVSKSMASEEGTLLPAPLKALPTTEAFTSAEVVEELELRSGFEPDEEQLEERSERRKIRHDLREDARAQLGPNLAEVDPVCLKIWEGARTALSSDNPERVRHFSASCRALLDHLLTNFAPRHKVESWSPIPVKLVNGKPERKAQLSYICRSLSGSSDLVEFTESDIDEVLQTFHLYNRGVHAPDPGLTAEEIDALETRTARHLLFLLSFRSVPN